MTSPVVEKPGCAELRAWAEEKIATAGALSREPGSGLDRDARVAGWVLDRLALAAGGGVTVDVAAAREKLRRAAEDGERLYRVRMHGYDVTTIKDDNRIDGILTIDLPDALGAYDRLVAELERLTKERSEGVTEIPAFSLQTVEGDVKAAYDRYFSTPKWRCFLCYASENKGDETARRSHFARCLRKCHGTAAEDFAKLLTALYSSEAESVLLRGELDEAREALTKAADTFVDICTAATLLRHHTLAEAASIAEQHTRNAALSRSVQASEGGGEE